MRIGIDLDGTLLQTYERMAEVYEFETGKVFDLSLVSNWNKESSVFQWIQKYVKHPEAYKNIAPYPNAIRVLKKLAKKHELHFITSRTPDAKEDTVRILNGYGFDNNIHFIPRKVKVECYQLLKVELVLEDELCFVEPFYGSKTKIILFDRPWNNQKNAGYIWGFRRIFSWQQVYPALHQLFEEM